MLLRNKKCKDWFIEKDLYNISYSIQYVMKILGIKIVSIKKVSDKNFMMILSIPQVYDKSFFGNITTDDVCKFIDKKIKSTIPSHKIDIVLAYSDKLNTHWDEADYYKAYHDSIENDIQKFKNLLNENNSNSIKVPVRKKNKYIK